MVAWSETAINELRAIYRYIALDSVYYAQETLNSIFSSTKPLERFHKMGKIVPELNDRSIREIKMSPYRLIYKVEKTGVIILSVLHEKRILRRHK